MLTLISQIKVERNTLRLKKQNMKLNKTVLRKLKSSLTILAKFEKQL